MCHASTRVLGASPSCRMVQVAACGCHADAHSLPEVLRQLFKQAATFQVPEFPAGPLRPPAGLLAELQRTASWHQEPTVSSAPPGSRPVTGAPRRSQKSATPQPGNLGWYLYNIFLLHCSTATAKGTALC